MQDFIQTAAKEFGIDAQQTSQATGSVLAFLKSSVPPEVMQQLTTKLPGADAMLALAGKAPTTPAAGGGWGSLVGKATAALGGDFAKLGDLLKTLEGFGLSAGQVTAFVGQFVTYLKSKLGEDIVRQIISSIPALANLTK